MLLAFGRHFGKFTVNVAKVVSMHGISNKARKLTYFLKDILRCSFRSEIQHV